jgi:nucleoside-diphosphate-sugar epimerase
MWNTRAIAEIETLGKNVHPGSVYLASKTYAERDSWAWVKEHAPSWDFVAVLPSYTWGPYIHEVRQATMQSIHQKMNDELVAVVSALVSI